MAHLLIIASTRLPERSLPILLLASLCCLPGGQVHAELAENLQQDISDRAKQDNNIRSDDLTQNLKVNLESVQPGASPKPEFESKATRYGVGYEYRMNRMQRSERPHRAQRPQRPNRPQRPGR